MLEDIGLERIEDLFDQIPEQLKLNKPIGIGNPISEPDLLEYFRELASANATGYQSFLGAGAYSHFIPVIIDSLISRAEFFTAYTPYQPELSQGTLQYTFEFQTMICQLTGMEVANASLYDGSTAVAEAVLMAHRITRREKAVLAGNLHPHYRETIATMARLADHEIVALPPSPLGNEELAAQIDGTVSCVVVQTPDF